MASVRHELLDVATAKAQRHLGLIKRLERDRDHPAHPRPDPETVELWASLWNAAGMEEPLAKAAALEFLIHCQSTEQTAAIAALNKWAHCESEG